jgi:hypothetical protein
MPDVTTLGRAFAEAFAAKDTGQIAALLHPEIDFRGLTPKGAWEANGAEQVVSDVLQLWLDDFNDGAKLVEVASHSFADTESLTYRFTGCDADGPFVCEQHAYLTERADVSTGCGWSARVSAAKTESAGFGQTVCSASSGVRETIRDMLSNLRRLAPASRARTPISGVIHKSLRLPLRARAVGCCHRTGAVARAGLHCEQRPERSSELTASGPDTREQGDGFAVVLA